MIPVPSYQVIEFMEWLRFKQVKIDAESFDYTKLGSLAWEYIESGGIQHIQSPCRDLLFILRVFQLCPKIHESDVIDQMRHFSQCGQCIEYIDRNSNRIFSFRMVQLHPFLSDFLDYCNRNGFTEQVSFRLQNDYRMNDLDDRTSLKDINHIFQRVIKEIGSELFEHFMRYIEMASPNLRQDYQNNRRSWARGRDIESERIHERRQHDDHTQPIGLNENTEQVSQRLVGSLQQLVHSGFYDEAISSNHAFLSHLLGFEGLPEHLAQSLEFLSWLNSEHSEIDITGDIPNNKVVDLVQSFCEDVGYSNASTFSKVVQKWLRGEGSPSLIDRIPRNSFRGHKNLYI